MLLDDFADEYVGLLVSVSLLLMMKVVIERKAAVDVPAGMLKVLAGDAAGGAGADVDVPVLRYVRTLPLLESRKHSELSNGL